MKHKIKMIATDLDGTLLRSDKTISERSKGVLSRCRSAGIKVVYATGRGPSARRIAPDELFDSQISMNGAVARIGNEIIHRRLIPYESARQVLLACHRRGLIAASEANDIHYTNFDLAKKWPGFKGEDFKIVDFSLHDIDAEKLYSFVNNPEDLAVIKNSVPDDLYLIATQDGFIQVMHKEASKSKALMELARIWGIDKAEILSFGDDLNDIDMLEYTGIGVAMGNAVDEVKSAADFVCDSNDDDGLAKWIEANVEI